MIYICSPLWYYWVKYFQMGVCLRLWPWWVGMIYMGSDLCGDLVALCHTAAWNTFCIQLIYKTGKKEKSIRVLHHFSLHLNNTTLTVCRNGFVSLQQKNTVSLWSETMCSTNCSLGAPRAIATMSTEFWLREREGLVKSPQIDGLLEVQWAQQWPACKRRVLLMLAYWDSRGGDPV